MKKTIEDILYLNQEGKLVHIPKNSEVEYDSYNHEYVFPEVFNTRIPEYCTHYKLDELFNPSLPVSKGV